MIEIDKERIKEQSAQWVDTAKKAAKELEKTAKDLADKGKTQMDLAALQGRLSKAQRQLGALVYSLHKAGEENQPLVDKYIAAVDEIEKEIEALKAHLESTPKGEAQDGVQEQESAKDDAAVQEDTAVAEPADPSLQPESQAGTDIEEEAVDPRGETKKCPVCQAEIEVDALFCTHCGAQL